MIREKLLAQPGVGPVSYQQLSHCWLLSVREVMIFVRKYHPILFKCLGSEPKKNRDGFDCVHRQVWGLGRESPILGSGMS